MRLAAIAACLASLALSACTAGAAPPGTLPAAPSIAGVVIPASPQAVANATTADERTAIAVQTAYAAGAQAIALAFRTGYVPLSADPDVKRPDFCQRVLAGTAVVTDKGGRLAALDCRAYAAALRVRALYGVANSASFVAAAVEANALVRQIVADIRAAR